MAGKFSLKMPDFHVALSDLLHAVNVRHGTHGFTSIPKEDVLRIFFSPWKIRRFRLGFNRRTLGSKVRHVEAAILRVNIDEIFILLS
jgi:hypothetical protein